MKKQPKKSTPQKSANSVPVDNKQPETPQVDNKQQETPSPQAATVTPPAPVTPPPAASTEKSKEETPKKEKAPSISAAVRRIVVKNPSVTAAEVSQKLIDNGWDAADVENQHHRNTENRCSLNHRNRKGGGVLEVNRHTETRKVTTPCGFFHFVALSFAPKTVYECSPPSPSQQQRMNILRRKALTCQRVA